MIETFADKTSNSANRALVEKLFNQGFSGGNLSVLDEVMSKDIHFHDPMFPG